MHARVTAIIVARDDETWLDRSLTAIAAQTRAPDAVVLVDAGSESGSAARSPRLAGAGSVVRVQARTFGAALAGAVAALPPPAEGELLWLLRGDAVPEPDALAALLGAVEVAPSVAIAGPKLVDPDDRALLRSFGVSVTRLGATVPLVDGDLDQAQHDAENDVLAVEAAGALVRREMWDRLGGLDRGLPTADAGLDLSIRARLAGARVVRVAGARVALGRRPEDFGRRTPSSVRALTRARRRAQLHRRLAYAPALVAPLHWLLLLPLALLRSVGRLLAKRPGDVPGEFAAATGAALDTSVPGARARLRRGRRVGWGALAPLRIGPDHARQRRAALRDRAIDRRGEPDLVRSSFLPGGLAVVAVVGVLSLVGGWRFLGAPALEGGALLPLSDVGTLWSRLGWPAPADIGSAAPADPFAAVLAVLGSLTAWAPSLSLVLLWLVALPVGALGAWWCATRLSERAWPPALAAALWAIAPSALAAWSEGRPGALLAHVLLPWLVLAVLEAGRSWTAAGAAGLLFAGVVAGAPILAPALLAGVVAWAIARPRGMVRVLGIPLPALALLAPLVVAQFARGTPLGLLADPGVVVPFVPPSGWQLLMGLPSAESDAWQGFAAAVGLPPGIGVLAPALLLVPFAAVALLALFLRGARRAIPATLLALAGLLTAVVAAHLGVAASGPDAVGPWPGSGLSLYWLGLTAALVVGMDALGKAAIVPGLAVLVASAAAVVPLAIAPAVGSSPVNAGDGRVAPALVVAEAATTPDVGSLVLVPHDDGSLTVRLDRGAGPRLDAMSTFAATSPEAGDDARALAELAGNLASRSGEDPRPALDRFGVRFVLVSPPDDAPDAVAVAQRAAEALDGTAALLPVGETSFGLLWQVPDAVVPDTPGAPSPWQSGILALQALVVGVAALLAVPTHRHRRVVRPAPEHPDPAGYEEDEDE
jgi:GT2 family glycosyltransferase